MPSVTVLKEQMVRHKHRWSKPYRMGVVGFVKACRAKGCPKRMKAVHPEDLESVTLRKR
jgi:hypothetical protein